MNLNDFNKAFKEHYIKPMDEFFRDRYRRMFKEEPPADSQLMMNRMIDHGEWEIQEIIRLNSKESGTTE